METTSQNISRRQNWFEDHPKFKQICSYGFNTDNPAILRSAMLVYLDLCEAKGWFKVNLHPCESLKLVYITGKPRKKAPMEIILPITIQTALTMAEIQDMIHELNCLEEERLEGIKVEENPAASVTMAISEADSTVVYYKLSSGLVAPEEPTEEEILKKAEKKQRRNKKKPRK